MMSNRILAVAAALFATVATTAASAALVGFVEDFHDGSTGGFGGGSFNSHIASGGVGGVDDGFLAVSESVPGELGTRNLNAEFTGALVADGVTGFSFWLNDVGADDALEIHVGVGRAFDNFWITTSGFSPTENAWQQYTVDITDASQWVQIIGTGTFEDAVSNTNRLLFRHDTAPLGQRPTELAGDFGIDRVAVVPDATTGVYVLLAGAALLSGRRRLSIQRH